MKFQTKTCPRLREKFCIICRICASALHQKACRPITLWCKFMLRSAVRKKAKLFMHSQRAYGGGAEAGIKFPTFVFCCVCSLFRSARGFLLFLGGFRPCTFGGGVVKPRLLLCARARPARGRRGRVGHGGVELSYEGPNGLAVSAGVQSCGKRAH